MIGCGAARPTGFLLLNVVADRFYLSFPRSDVVAVRFVRRYGGWFHCSMGVLLYVVQQYLPPSFPWFY